MMFGHCTPPDRFRGWLFVEWSHPSRQLTRPSTAAEVMAVMMYAVEANHPKASGLRRSTNAETAINPASNPKLKCARSQYREVRP